ncbi:sulfatase family protein [Azohydromonas australica]|uniref:sulfatase family protein n=1 Tax=Azohydromonas australica TaxID=364039 RepID=UPI00146D15BD|nr:sulfatase [Azohydromonas australica]
MKPARQSVQGPVNISRRRLALAATASLAMPAKSAPPGGEHRNILFITVDDMDVGVYQHMSKLRRLVTQPGIEFANHFISLTLCCPSRATMLRGQFAHNTGIRDNVAPDGGFGKFYLEGKEASTVATWLQAAGYRTAMMGKYLNNYPSVESGMNYVPPGWNTWFVANGGSYYTQYWYSVNDNGTTRNYGGAPEDHFQNVLLRRAQQFLRSAAADPPGRPFFLFLAPFLPHKPYRVQVEYEDLFPGIQAPRPPSFNEADVSDKPTWVQRLPRLGPAAVSAIDTVYRKQRQCAASLDDMVERLVWTLRSTGQLGNTYIFFTSDNGFFHGEHRIADDKRRAYEEAIRAPLVVRGPSIPAGRVARQVTGNVDFAPTFAALAGVTPPDFVDGRSLVPLLGGAPVVPWRRAFLLESQTAQAVGAELAYAGLRTTARQSFVLYDNGEGEFYELATDPYQLRNRYAGMPVALKGALAGQLGLLRNAGGAALRSAEEMVAGA